METFGNIGSEDGGYISVTNDGPELISTNYWTSSEAKAGVCYFSVNAGCVRLLLPSTISSGLDDDVLDGTQYVIITRGRFEGRDGYEVLFEDGSNSPFVIRVLANQWDRPIPAFESGRTDLGFDIYRDGKRIRQLTARFRAVATLPYWQPWGS